jgi:hypothetical protein
MSQSMHDDTPATPDFVSTSQGQQRALERPLPAGTLEQRQPDPTADAGPLLPADFVKDLRGRWDQVQSAFVDEPRDAVQKADGLVKEAIDRLSESFSETRSRLEGQWSRGEEASTEDLRMALQRYRSFFQRLLAV